MLNKFSILQLKLFWVLLVYQVSFIPAEEVCKFAYKGQPEELRDSTIVLPAKVVALSEYFYVGMTAVDTVTEKATGKIFKTKPKVAYINGKLPSIGWDGTGFTFLNPYPLLAEQTVFAIMIEYEITMDSITDNGDTIQIFESDTTVSFDYTVKIEDGTILSDTVELTCWGRKLEICYNDIPVAIVDETMDTLELRFSEVEVDTVYDYYNVSIELTNKVGTQTDKETFMLTDTGPYFTCTFPRIIDSTPNPGDGVLQHQVKDTIIAAFKNQDLPLDTLRVSVPYIHSSAIYSSKTFSRKLDLSIVRTGAGQHILRFSNLPGLGKMKLYTVNGRKILDQSLRQGNVSLFLPKAFSHAVYFMHFEFGEHAFREKILLF